MGQDVVPNVGIDRIGRSFSPDNALLFALIAIYWVAFQFVYCVYYLLSYPEYLGLKALEDYTPLGFAIDFAIFFLQPVELLCCAFGALISFAIYMAIRAGRRWRLRWQLPSAIAAMAAGACAFTLLTNLSVNLLLHPEPMNWLRFMRGSIVWLAPIGLWAGAALAVVYNRETRERERQFALLESQAHVAQIRALRFQVNPHFLFNTLNSISALILDGRSGDAERMLLALATFFRTTLDGDPLRDVRLADEMALQRLYLQIEQARFGSRLHVDIDLPAALDEARLPGLLLQPLVENAIRHGMSDGRRQLHLHIGARENMDDLIIEVRDDGAGMDTQAPAGTGVGLDNVRQRLSARFGDRARVRAMATPRGFGVELTMPLVAA
ncbi:sensor histidine kinase [Sphingomonas crocodyli]|nr:histidine kinase [Sphingomonas crocodyli]